MQMTPRIEIIKERMLVGLQVKMSLANNKTSELWREFLRRKNEVINRSNTDRYSIQIYNQPMDAFTPHTEFDRWAALEVTSLSDIPKGMKPITIEGGQYAVFIHHGAANNYQETFQYIFETWLPASSYQVDQRAHFEIMQQDYNPFDENAKEEVWIPIKLK